VPDVDQDTLFDTPARLPDDGAVSHTDDLEPKSLPANQFEPPASSSPLSNPLVDSPSMNLIPDEYAQSSADAPGSFVGDDVPTSNLPTAEVEDAPRLDSSNLPGVETTSDQDDGLFANHDQANDAQEHPVSAADDDYEGVGPSVELSNLPVSLVDAESESDKVGNNKGEPPVWLADLPEPQVGLEDEGDAHDTPGGAPTFDSAMAPESELRDDYPSDVDSNLGYGNENKGVLEVGFFCVCISHFCLQLTRLMSIRRIRSRLKSHCWTTKRLLESKILFWRKTLLQSFPKSTLLKFLWTMMP